MDKVKTKIKAFLFEYLPDINIEDDIELFSSGLVNSMFGVELVLFIEKEFNIVVTDEDLTLDNFNTINAIVSFTRRKQD